MPSHEVVSLAPRYGAKHDPAATERLIAEARAAFSELTNSWRRALAAARRLQAHAEAVAEASGQQLVQVKRSPPRDPATGKIVRHPRRGRPKGAKNGATALTLYATEAQIEQLRATLRP